MSQVKSQLVPIIFVGLELLTGCVSSDYKPIKNPSELKESFVDSSWDGMKVPVGQHCKKYGCIRCREILRSSTEVTTNKIAAVCALLLMAF